MFTWNDGPEIEFRRKGELARKPIAPADAHYEHRSAAISPASYFLFSLVMPGLGQLLLGLVFQALVFFFVAIGCWYMLYSLGADMFYPIMIAHFGAAISAGLKAKGEAILRDLSHLTPSD